MSTSTSTMTAAKASGLTDPPLHANAAPNRPGAPARTIVGDLREIVAELRQSRDLIQQLTLRDIRIRYKQAVFGFAWALLIPAAVVLSGLAVRVALSYAAGRGLDWSQIGGMAVKALPWAFFVGCLNSGTASLIANKSLVTKIYFPREVLPLGSVLAQSFDTMIGLGLLTVVLPFLGVRPSWQLLWVPALLFTLWTFALATALLLSCLNLFFRDVKYLVQIFLTFGIFITPVIFDAPMFGELGARILMLNPVAPILEGLRLSVVQQHNLLQPLTVTSPVHFVFWQPWYLLYAGVWAFGGILFSAVVFHRSERHFAEVV
ncbi:MAG: ABC transporter permease [Phycisphaerae bacterium]|nr:ABC transporter permease [Gemmatimonadaceae bacterium]